MAVVGRGDILLAVRYRQDHDGDLPKCRIALEIVKDFPPAPSRQKPVEENDVWPKPRLRAKQGERLLAVLDDGDARPDARLAQGAHCPLGLGERVLDQQDLQRRRGPARSGLSSRRYHSPSSNGCWTLSTPFAARGAILRPAPRPALAAAR